MPNPRLGIRFIICKRNGKSQSAGIFEYGSRSRRVTDFTPEMTTSSRFDSARRELRRKLKEKMESELAAGLRIIDEFERLGLEMPSETLAVSIPQNDDGEQGSWAEAIDAALAQHPMGMTVNDLTDFLVRSGRKFPRNTKATVSVGAVLTRKAEDMHWEAIGKRPRLWRRIRKAEA